jgi:hypothetical protein
MTWGNPFADHYSLAWLDRWLKQSGEAGYADADQRLLVDKDWGARMSFYFRNARDFTDTAAPFTPPPWVPTLPALAENVGPGCGAGGCRASRGVARSAPQTTCGVSIVRLPRRVSQE